MNEIDELEVVKQYKQFFFEMMRFNFPNLSYQELDDVMNWSINKRIHNTPLKLQNSYKNTEMDSSILDIVEYILDQEPIMTPSGVLFKKHNESKNPINKMIQGFLTMRKKYKKEMFKYPKGSSEFEKFNLLQLLEKVSANSIYGCLN